MKKKYSTPNLIKAVSLSAAMATLLSSVSPVFAAGVSITGGIVRNSSGLDVPYPNGSHGSIVLAGDDDFCGVDNVIGRGGKQQENASNKITAEDQYKRFINNQADNNSRNPYGTTTKKVTWSAAGGILSDPKASYMGTNTGGAENIMPEAFGVYSFATGCGSSATGNYSTAFGAGATAKTGGSQAFGVSALASGKATVAIGIGSEASGESSIAFGGLATASGKESVALGFRTKASKEYAIAIGSKAEATASGAIAIGGSEPVEDGENKGQERYAQANAKDAIAIGSFAHAAMEDSVAIGSNAQVRVKDGVAIGGGSVSRTERGVKGYDPSGQEATKNGIAWVSTAGAFSVGEVGGSDGDGQGQLTRQITGVAAGKEDTDAVNVAQLKAVANVMAGEGGWKLSVNGDSVTDVAADSTIDFSVEDTTVGKGNLTIEKINGDNKHKIQFALNDNLKLISVTTGRSSMSDDGFIFADGAKITVDGINAGNEKITGVADGEEDTDAVNFKQLTEVKGLISKAGGWKFSVNGDQATDVAAGSTVDFVGINAEEENEESKNIKITKGDNNKVQFALNDIIRVKRVIAGKANVSDDGFVITGGPNMTTGGINAGQKKITGVADGKLENDAVNVSQLNEVKNQITENSLVKWDEKKKLITIGAQKDGTKIDITGTGGERTIAGVKDGAVHQGSREAVNGSQLWDTNKTVEHLGKRVDNISSTVTDVSREVNQLFQDALLWSEEEGAFVARHGTGEEKKNSKIKFLANGHISKESTDAINGSQIHSIGSDIAKYFGGNTSFENGVFTGPRYNLTTIDANSEVAQAEYNDVGSALSGLDTNIRNVNHHFINAMNDVAKYFGGGAGYDKNGEWHAPTFYVYNINDNGTVSKKPHQNVADAFEDVNNTFTNIHNQISDITKNSLVKQEEENGFITIGKETGGTKISIANKDGKERTISKVANGAVREDSTEAINGSQLFKVAQNTSKYFGGSTDVLEGIKPAFLIDGKEYNNVFDAFTGVNVSINKIDNKISDLEKNSLVKWDEEQKLITIGKDKAGTEINISGYGKVARKISGVQAAENDDEAVNKGQLDKSIDKISKDIETVTAAAVLYDKNEEGKVNYGSVTLGGDKHKEPVALHNVKDGSIAEGSHDAINGSQINKISADIAKFFGGGAKFINGAFEGLKYTLSLIFEDGTVGKADYGDVGSALKGLDGNVKSVNQRLTKVSNEFNQKIEGISKDALLWDDDEGVFVARHEKDGKTTNNKIKYLADGDISKDSTDAINGSQLYVMSNKLASYFGGGAKYENGKWTAPTFNIVQVDANGKTIKNSYNTVSEAFDGISNGMSNINNRIDDVVNKVDSEALKWNEDKGAYDAKRDDKPNKIINVADGKVAEGSKEAVNGGQLWKTNERVANVENRVTGVEKDVKHLTNRVDNISSTVTDIGETVYNIENKVDKIDNKVNDIAEDAVRYDRDENGNKTNKITLAGGDASEPVVIDNVADGQIEKGSKEAVNGGQLHDYTKEQMKIVLDESKQYTDQRIKNITVDAIDDAVDQSKQYTDMKFDILNYSIENVKKEARQAAAIGLAVSNLRYNDTPGKLSVGFGTGLWRSQSAFAFGAGYTSENGKFRSNVSATTSGGHWGVGAGFNMTLN
ncbi:Vomp family autotransporter [Bartonella massiliensis]|uniref:Vomp family autotransporter n=1 Tax=Bartonella massiliensis TaxID=929795 RepID=UPI001158B07F|nr:Vomp family autotransporter [Bartonella massiliensis]